MYIFTKISRDHVYQPTNLRKLVCAGPQTVQSTEVLISSSVCCTSTCSFYNTAGDIDSKCVASAFLVCSDARPFPCPTVLHTWPDGPLSADTWFLVTPCMHLHTGTRLAALIPPGVSLLGWFSFRAGMGSTLQPSMRELAVTRNLAAHMPSAPRADSLPLLLKVSTSLDHNNGTLTTNYR